MKHLKYFGIGLLAMTCLAIVIFIICVAVLYGKISLSIIGVIIIYKIGRGIHDLITGKKQIVLD